MSHWLLLLLTVAWADAQSNPDPSINPLALDSSLKTPVTISSSPRRLPTIIGTSANKKKNNAQKLIDIQTDRFARFRHLSKNVSKSAQAFEHQVDANNGIDNRILPILSNAGSPGSPGVREHIGEERYRASRYKGALHIVELAHEFRHVFAALDQIRDLGMAALNREIPKIRMPGDMTGTLPANLGHVTVSDSHVSQYWKPPNYELKTKPRNSIVWSMTGFGVEAKGSYVARIIDHILPALTPIQLPGFLQQVKTAVGNWTATVRPATYEIEMLMRRDANGYPSVSAENCRCKVQSFNVDITNPDVLVVNLVNSIKNIIHDHVRPRIEAEVCTRTEALINEKANVLLDQLELKIPLNTELANFDNFGGLRRRKRQVDQNQILNNDLLSVEENEIGDQTQGGRTAVDFVSNRHGDLSSFISKIRDPRLMISLLLTEAPRTFGASDGVRAEVPLRGEVSWNGIGGTPFDPAPMSDGVADKMVQVAISDFVVNSFFYHAHANKLFDFYVSADATPRLQQQLRTTCEEGYCLGTLVWPLATQYPDHLIDFKLRTKRMPTMVFQDTGATVFLLHAILDMYARNTTQSTDESVQVINADVRLVASGTFQFDSDGNRVYGLLDVDFLELKLNPEQSVEGIDQYMMDDLAAVCESVVGTMANGALRNGIALPELPGGKLKNPHVKVFEHYITIDTDLELGPELLAALASGL